MHLYVEKIFLNELRLILNDWRSFLNAIFRPNKGKVSSIGGLKRQEAYADAQIIFFEGTINSV
ncbi:hypothetical protein BJP41_09925 (plasmid) [Candidatus Williamhamiltonella defendens]|uniref:Uncharacterized protein n=1 Tax=Candidatus Williamhamiltonella defendens TaxID=138072 RepID=A0A2D3T5H8_9ENTR|nr:hypothetical protein BJP41_09925 [Candidatus Hamiltonella defensa]